MKKIVTLIFALMMTIALWAYDFKSGDLYYNITSSSEPYTVEVTYQYNWSETNYSNLTNAVIPESVTYNGTTYSVTSIGENAFYDCQVLTSVTIPNSVTTIGERAFSSCYGLTSVTIPTSVTSIGKQAFRSCHGLKSVVWNAINCVDFSYSSMEGPFDSDNPSSKLTSFTFGDSVQHIPAYLCYQMTKLTSVTIPNSVTSIGTSAFFGCSGLKSPVYNAHCFAYMPTSYQGEYVIPEGIKQISGWAFAYCRNLTSITIPKSVTSIGDEAFRQCSSLTSVVWNAINCTGSVQFETFSGGYLTSITFGDSVQHIPAYLCSGMTKLTSVTLPNSVTSVGNAAFYGCHGLTSPVYNAHCFAYLPTSYEGEYVIPDGIKQIAGSAFRGCVGLTSVTIPNSVTSIGEYAFYGCSGLKSINIPNSLTSIERHTFDGCSSLTSITIPNSVTEIGNYAFDGCSGLTSITIPNSVTSLGECAFDGCSGLTSVTIPNSVMGIGGRAFYGCSGLTSITIPNSVTSIGNYTFGGCSSLTSITIPNSVTSIGEGAFDGCSSLTSITIPNSVTSIGYSAFSRCSGLTSVTIGNSVESIDYYAFSECSNLGKIILGSSLKEISPYAFEECRKLFDIYCYAVDPPVADENSFANYNVYLYSPCDNLRAYQLDAVFGSFKYFECIGSESTTTDDVVVDPGSTDATISWPTEEDAETYSIVIYKDGEVFCTLTFNSNGQLVNIAFAPGRRGNHPVRFAEATTNGYRFTVTGLDESTKYGYNLDVKDDSSKTIKSYEGEFTTNSATGVEDVVISDGTTQKLLRDGQLLIIRDGKTYNAQGAAL